MTETKTYTIQATGESTSVTRVKLTDAELAGVIKVCDAINGADTGSYEPNVWIWPTKDIPRNSAFEEPTMPVNPLWYGWWRRDGDNLHWMRNTPDGVKQMT